MAALPNQLVINDDAEARVALIEDLEAMKPQANLGSALVELRLKVLRAGQRLFSLDEINQESWRFTTICPTQLMQSLEDERRT